MFCPNCGGEFASPAEGKCPHCGHEVGYAPSPPPSAPPPPPDVPAPPMPGGAGAGGPGAPGGMPPAEEPSSCPFEDPRLGFFDGLVETVKQVFARPAPFFRRLPDTSDIGRPFLFFMIFTAVGAFFKMVWALVLVPLRGDTSAQLDQMRASMETSGLPPEQAEAIMKFMEMSQGPGGPIGGFFINIVISLFLLFIAAALLHLFLMMFGGANRGFGGTFRVVAYTQATALAMLVPMCGEFAAAIWAVILFCIGLTQVHRTDPWRAILAVLLLPLLCCVLCCAAAMMFGMAAGAAGAGG